MLLRRFCINRISTATFDGHIVTFIISSAARSSLTTDHGPLKTSRSLPQQIERGAPHLVGDLQHLDIRLERIAGGDERDRFGGKIHRVRRRRCEPGSRAIELSLRPFQAL
jgi:hypothetical protein